MMKPANILKIKTLGKDWSDKDVVMLHACFQLLTDCIEQEKLYERTDWNHNEEYKQAKKEIDELYTWWKSRVKTELENLMNPSLEKDQYEEDNEMLIRLVKVRGYLWT